MNFIKKLFSNSIGQKPVSEKQQLGQIMVKKFRQMGKVSNCAPTAKTSDDKIVEIYALVGSAFKKIAETRGENIPAKNLNGIVFKFIQVYEMGGDTFFREHLSYEIEKYQEEGLRADYLNLEIGL